MNFAPIGISTYIRLDHLRRTVDALARNEGARQSDLHFFSDGPRPGDESAVAEVRAYLRTVTGFRSTTVWARESNGRVRNNRDGIERLLAEHGRIIFLEEDVITAPQFLNYINDGLDVFRYRPDIYAICAYTPPVALPLREHQDTFLCPRFSSWGFGIWRDRYHSAIRERGEFRKTLNDPAQLRRLRGVGEDYPAMLRRQADGELDGFDVISVYTQFRRGQFVVCPHRSLTHNTGHDGTGIHCGTTRQFDVELDLAAGPLRHDQNLAFDPRIAARLYRFRSRLPNSLPLRTLKQYLIRPLDRTVTRPLGRWLNPKAPSEQPRKAA